MTKERAERLLKLLKERAKPYSETPGLLDYIIVIYNEDDYFDEIREWLEEKE